MAVVGGFSRGGGWGGGKYMVRVDEEHFMARITARPQRVGGISNAQPATLAMSKVTQHKVTALSLAPMRRARGTFISFAWEEASNTSGSAAASASLLC